MKARCFSHQHGSKERPYGFLKKAHPTAVAIATDTIDTSAVWISRPRLLGYFLSIEMHKG